MMGNPAVDHQQIATFAEALLKYASEGVHVSLRAFLEGRPQPLRITTAKINGSGVAGIVPAAIEIAELAAASAEGAVFCPPIAGFSSATQAREIDLVEAYALSVESDARAAEARIILEQLLGPATVVVASGGEWINADTGEIEPKLHLHWRLSEPATGEDLARLKAARRHATAIVGGDPSNVPATHPIRWPGSVHRKGTPRLAQIIALNEGAEIELGHSVDVLEARAALMPGAGPSSATAADRPQGAQDGGEYETLVANILRGDSLHVSLDRLAAKMVGSGMAGGAVVLSLRGMMQASLAARDDRWQARYDDIWRDVSTAEAKFRPTHPANDGATPTDFEPTGFTGEVPPPRPWAYGNFLMERAVTGIAAPPGVGKTTFSFQIGLAFALDLQLGPWTPRPGGGGKVWLYNGEEPKDELDRRFIAACMEMGVQEADASKRFAYNSGLTTGLKLGGQDDKGRFVRSPDVDRIKALIHTNGFKLFILDPLTEFHEVKESDPDAFGRVGAICREIANDCDCAVLIFHHTPKAANGDTSAGDMNALRGTGQLIGVARFVHTMFGMTLKDAVHLGISAKERPSFVRFDDAKANMAPVEGGAVWWRKLGVTIGNAAGVRPADNIGVLRVAHLEPVEATTEIDRRAAAEQTETTLAREVIRVCLANGHSTPETATPLTKLCEALDKSAIEMGATTARGVITGRMSEGFEVDGYRIVMSHSYRGKLHLQHIHIEPVEVANAAA